MEEGYPSGWERVVVMVSPDGETHHIGGSMAAFTRINKTPDKPVELGPNVRVWTVTRSATDTYKSVTHAHQR